MANILETPYSLSLQSVLNEFCKYTIKLVEAHEFGVKHDAGTKINLDSVKLTSQLKSMVLCPTFNSFMNKLDSDILKAEIVLGRPHNISIAQPTYKASYELASMALMFSNTCLMKESEYHKNSTKYKCYNFLKRFSRKIFDICISLMSFIIGSTANIMSHFLNSMSHEIDTRGAKDG